MGGFSIWHWLIVLFVVLILFGRGRVSEIMGDFGKGIKSFKDGMNEDDKSAPPAQITAKPADPVPPATPTPTATPAPASTDHTAGQP